MQKQLELVKQWNDAFGVAYPDQPTPLDPKAARFRYILMKEELNEWQHEALFDGPVTNRAKELADLVWVALGTVIQEGLQDQFEKVFQAVYVSNMSKLGDDGKPTYRDDGKINKGPNYVKADLSFLTEHPPLSIRGESQPSNLPNG